MEPQELERLSLSYKQHQQSKVSQCKLTIKSFSSRLRPYINPLTPSDATAYSYKASYAGAD